MKPKSTSFEVQVLQDKRWVVNQVIDDESAAVEFADNLLSKSNYTAVRVVRNFARQDGLHSETVVLEKTKAAQKTEISTSTVGEAPICTELSDAFGLSSRLTIGRLFRAYLDEVLLTPTELLHNAREMKRLADKGSLLMNAVDQISRLQAPQGGEEGKTRRDFLHRSWEQLWDRARKAAPEKAPKGLTLAEVMAQAGKSGEDAYYQARVLISAMLLDKRGWIAKLDKVLFWAAEEGADKHMALLDGLVADLLIPAEAIQDLLGFQANLAAALAHMCDLAVGKAEEPKGAAESFATLNRLFGAGALPQAQESLFSRVARELRSTNPLSRNEPAQEFEAFLKLLNRLIAYEGVTGGPPMAEALTHRYVRGQSVGGQAGLQNAIDDLSQELGGRARATIYLMTLLGAPKTAELFGEQITRKLTRYVEDRGGIDDWVPSRLSPPDRMGALTRCNKAIQASKILPDKLRVDLATTTDIVLVDYLEYSGVIEKIDKPEDPLAFRALRLVKFCASGVLIKGRALEMAHKRVLGHLRQANFEEKFLSSIPDKAQAEKHLREFHKLLVESGFKF
jgi:hypothetical protein